MVGNLVDLVHSFFTFADDIPEEFQSFDSRRRLCPIWVSLDGQGPRTSVPIFFGPFKYSFG